MNKVEITTEEELYNLIKEISKINDFINVTYRNQNARISMGKAQVNGRDFLDTIKASKRLEEIKDILYDVDPELYFSVISKYNLNRNLFQDVIKLIEKIKENIETDRIILQWQIILNVY